MLIKMVSTLIEGNIVLALVAFFQHTYNSVSAHVCRYLYRTTHRHHVFAFMFIFRHENCVALLSSIRIGAGGSTLTSLLIKVN